MAGEGWTAMMLMRFQQLRREMTEDISKQIKASEDRLRQDLGAEFDRLEDRLEELEQKIDSR